MAAMKDIKTLKVDQRISYFFDDIEGDEWDAFLTSVRMNGVIVPLTVRPDGTIICGAQRYRACMELGIRFVPCDECTFATADEETLAIIDSNIRQRGVVNSPSVKLGRIIMELERINGLSAHKRGAVAAGQISRTEIREQIGVDRKVAACSKSIAQMPNEVQALIEEKVITPRVAYDHLNGLSAARQKEVAQSIADQYTGSRVLTSQVKKIVGRKPEQKGAPVMTEVFSITRDILGAKVVIALTEDEVTAIARQIFERGLKPAEPKRIQEPETKKEWKPVRAYTTGVIAQHRDDVIRMYQQGNSCLKIARKYGVAEQTVCRFLHNSGVQVRTPQEANKLRWGKPAA